MACLAHFADLVATKLLPPSCIVAKFSASLSKFFNKAGSIVSR